MTYDIVIVSLPGIDKNKPAPALGYLKGFLTSYGFKVLTIDGNQVDDLDKLHVIVSQYQFEFIGISVFSYLQKDQALLFGKEYKNVIYGGSGVYPGWPHKNYIVGDGEIALLEFLKGNLSYPGINGTYPVEIKDLNTIPVPDYTDLLSPNLYKTNYNLMPITGSRGCVRNCSFCNIADRWPVYRFVDGDILASNMIQLSKNTKFRNISLTDSLVNGSQKHFNLMCNTLAASDHKISWRGQFIIRKKNSVLSKNFDDIADSGCAGLEIGIESGSEKIRNHMNKKFLNEDMDFFISHLLERNIKLKFLLIVGYPTETKNDFNDTVQFLTKWKSFSKNIHVSIDIMRIEPGSPIIKENNILYTLNDDWHNWENSNSNFEVRYNRYIKLFDHAKLLGYSIIDQIELKREKFTKYKNGLPVII